MPDPMIEIAKIIDSQIESRLSKFKKDMQKYVDNCRIGAEQIEPGAIIPPKLAPVPLSKIPQLKEITDDMQEAIETAEQNVAEAQTRIDGAESDLIDARYRLATAENSISDTQGNVSTLQSTASTLSSDIMNAKGDISTLEQQADGFTTAISNAQGDISTLQSTASTLTSDISNARGDISTLQQTAQGLETSVTNAEGAISALELTAQGLTTAVGNANGNISMLQQKADEFTTAIANAEDDISAVQQTADKINWLVKSGDSASNMTLTDRTFDLVANDINLNGKVTFTGLDPSTRSQVTNGNNANTTVSTWRMPGKTTINGGMIETDTVKAVQIDVDNLFADAATINALKTSVISNISIGGNNLLKNSAFEFGMASWEVMEWESTGTNKSCVVMGKGGTYEPGEANTLQFRATNETGIYGAQQQVSGLTKNTDYTFSGYVRQDRMTGNVAVNVAYNVDWTDHVYTRFDAPTGTNTDSLSGYGRFSYTFNTGNHTSFRLAVWGENYGSDGVIWITRLQLEQGDVATEWRPSASEFKSSRISLSDGGVSIDAGVFAVNVSGTNGDMSLDESGLSVAKVNSDSVTPRYTGAAWLEVNKSATDAQVQSGSHFRSLGDALKTVDGMYLDYSVRINLAPDTYYEGYIEANGINGKGQLTIVGNGAVLNNTHLWFCGCGTLIEIVGVKMTRLTDSGQCISFRVCKMARIADSVFTGTSKTDWSCAVLAEWGSSVLVEGCEAYNWQYSWMNNAASTIVTNDCKGDCAVLCCNSTMIVNGTQPSPTTTYSYNNWGGLFQNNGATVDMGTATPPVPETATATFAATTMRTIHGTGEWSPTWLSAQNYTLQGYTSGGGRMYSALWFSGLSTLAGKTILSAKLTLRRILPTGRSGPAKVVAYYGALSNAAGSGAPSSRTSIGLLGSLENPQTGTFTIPTAAIAYLAGGATGRCLALNPSDSALWNGKDYSENHARFAGVGSAHVPELTVIYRP